MRGKGLLSLLAALAAGLATVVSPALAQDLPAAAMRFEGPVPPIQNPSNDSAFVAAVRQQADACGLQADALQVTQERVSVEPATEAEEAALDARVEDVSARAGFTGPKESRQVSRASIRAMLTQRLMLTLAYAGAEGEEGMACLVGALSEAGYSSVDKASAE